MVGQQLRLKPKRFSLAIVFGLSDPAYRRWCKIRKWVWLGMAIMTIVVFGWWAIATKFLTVKSIIVYDQVRVTPSVVPLSQINNLAKQWRGASVWSNTAAMSQQVLKQFPSLASARVAISFPDKLELFLLPRVALCQLITPNGVYLVDRRGIIFAKLPNKIESLPSLQSDVLVRVGQVMPTSGLSLGLSLVTSLRTSQPNLESITLHDGQLDVRMAGPPIIFISAQRPADDVLPQLQAMLLKFNQDKHFPAQVDMKFERPVITY